VDCLLKNNGKAANFCRWWRLRKLGVYERNKTKISGVFIFF